MTPLTGSMTIVGAAYAPFAVAKVATTGLDPMSLLLQAPLMGILVLLVWMFLRHLKDIEERRLKREKDADDRRSAESERSSRAIEGLQQMAQQDAVVRGRTVEVMERLEKTLDRRRE